MLFTLLFSLSAFAAPKELPAHRVVASDGGAIALPAMSIAVLGNSREGGSLLSKAKAIGGAGTNVVVGDITTVGVTTGLDAVFLLGDQVTASTPGNWRDFAERHAAILDGTQAPPAAMRRFPVIPVVGDKDCIKEPSCASVASVFPGFGVEIGFGRVATWQQFDVAITDAETWRVLVLDSNKKNLKSRWQEQVAWLKNAVANPGAGLVILMHEPPVARAYKTKHEGEKELMAVINEHAPLLSVRLVLSAGPVNHQALLPEGALGPLFVNAGGGGAAGEDLDRGTAENPEGPQLAEAFEKGVNALVDSHLFNPEPPDAKAIDQALGNGAFAGFPRTVDADVFPMHGWWKLDFAPGSISLQWRARKGDGIVSPLAAFSWSQETGWVGSN
jgi:hypothetical protein